MVKEDISLTLTSLSSLAYWETARAYLEKEGIPWGILNRVDYGEFGVVVGAKELPDDYYTGSMAPRDFHVCTTLERLYVLMEGIKMGMRFERGGDDDS